MHNTTHYRTLTRFAVMFLALVVTGCPGNGKKGTPKKVTKKNDTHTHKEQGSTTGVNQEKNSLTYRKY